MLFETTATTAELSDEEVYELIHEIKLQLAEDRPLMIEAKVAPDENDREKLKAALAKLEASRDLREIATQLMAGSGRKSTAG